MRSALLLIAFGFGFKIFAESSEKQKKSIKQFGTIVGIIMMVISLCGVLCIISLGVRGMKCGFMSSAYCPLQSSHNEIMGQNYRGMKCGKKSCPMMSGSMENEPATAAEKKGK